MAPTSANGANTFSVVRAQRELFGWATASAYYAYFTQDSAKYLSVSGNERRDSIDARFAAKINARFRLRPRSDGPDREHRKRQHQGAVGSLSGYTFAGIGWTPRLGFQFDAASGDRNRRAPVRHDQAMDEPRRLPDEGPPLARGLIITDVTHHKFA
jgi:hypothetical protein